MNRREFVKGLGGAAAIPGASVPAAAAADSGAAPTIYFVDGYHGGIRGHMPAGAWRDIVQMMRRVPEWKVSFDIEPVSWETLRREDPQAYREIQRLLADQSIGARVEMLNGTFGQPFGWAVGGESNIRQLLYGIELVRRHFPDAVIETYAVQEPCWSSCLPQILRSLGFTFAVLKNPGTAWGGYTAGFDAETVDWVGPDGSSIPTVPRYACEELVRVYETESAYATVDFTKKCVSKGIPHPTGTYLQDLGWAARPKVIGSHIRYVTWREYMRKVAEKPRRQWRFTQEDILVTLPWGEKTIQNLARQVRSAENLLAAAEKIASIASILRGAEFPAQRLRRAWEQVLWSQHHDAWITATTRSGRQAWAFQVAAETLEAEEICRAIIASSAEALSQGEAQDSPVPLGPQWARVFNTVASEREDIVEHTWTCDPGTRGARVFDPAGNEVPCQLVRPRRYSTPDATSPLGKLLGERSPRAATGGLNSATVVFRARTPGIGYNTYKVEPVYGDGESSARSGALQRQEPDGAYTLETDLYRVRIDPALGGAITSLFVKGAGSEYCDPSSERRFNEYRGYFITEKQWCSSTETPASVRIVENGPVRTRTLVSGRVGGRRVETTVTMAQGLRRIDFNTRFFYDQDTWIGDPWDIKPEDRRSERRRSHHDGRWKLQAFFPVPFKRQSLYKNSAFDVCRSRHDDTYFQGWHEIKHNIILNWIDLFDDQSKMGLAVLSDHTTAYTHGPDHPLALVMGWGWEGGFWWGKCPLRGVQEVNYSLIPHTALWDEARVSEESVRWSEPLFAQVMNGKPATGDSAQSLLAGTDGLEFPTVQFLGEDVLVRVFNAAGAGGRHKISLLRKPSQAELVELNGKAIRTLQPEPARDGRFELALEIPRFGIRTIRLRGLAGG